MKSSLSAALISLACILPAWAEPASATPPLAPSTVAVTVDTKTITIGDLDKELKRPDLQAAVEALAGQESELLQLKRGVLAAMVDKELLIRAAKASPHFKQEDVSKEVNDIVSQQGGQATIEPILKSYGTTWDSFMSDMGDRVAIEKFVELDLLASVQVSDEQLKATFAENPSLYAEPETVSARHILVLVKANASPDEDKQAREKIDAIHKRVTAPGADFAKIASETTDDTATKPDGGNLGSFGKGMMVPEFENAAFALKVGEISPPIKTSYGYHIIKVHEHKQAQEPSFEKSKDKVRYQVMAKTHDKVVTEKLTQLRNAAKIEYKVAELKKS
jgi:parvulin-like peptidyl-prolyl isomerase